MPIKNPLDVSISQWASDSNDRFRPAGPSFQSLPAGTYSFNADERGIYIQKVNMVTDNLIELDDPASTQILKSIRTFWDSEHEYTSRGVVYKRGILLYGPAGSGKTALLTLLMQELVRRGGIVIICSHVDLTKAGIPLLRRIEPTRPLILVMEDIEEIIRSQGEHNLLAMLDGEYQIGNVVSLATTNYPEELGARIVNRPSRFDERILIGMPSAFAREKYLRHITRKEFMPDTELHQWVKDSEGFSIAHLRELSIAVFCLKQPYEEVVARLKTLQVAPKPIKEFKGGLTGFALQARPSTISGGG